MITAKDIQRKKFEKVKFGYSPEEVDDFLSQIENDIRVMQQELDDSNEKMQLLADKVREYKESEEDLKNALLLAQKQARQVVAEAQEKAAAIEAEAKASVSSVKEQAIQDADAQLHSLTERLNKEAAALVNTQQQVSEFKRTLFDMYKEHLELISRLPENADAFGSDEDSDEETEEIIEYVEEEVEEEAEEAAEDAAETASETETAANAAFDGVAQSTFGSRRDEARRDEMRKRFDY